MSNIKKGLYIFITNILLFILIEITLTFFFVFHKSNYYGPIARLFLFEKKVSFSLTDGLQGVNIKVVLLYKESIKISLFQPLICIGLSYEGLIIINRFFWLRKIFFICITYPRNKMKVIWCSKKSPCRFLQKVLIEGRSWHGLCPKSLLKAQVPHFSTSDVRMLG